MTSKHELVNDLFWLVSSRELEEVLPNVADQVINDVREAQKKYQAKVMDDVSEAVLRQQILAISAPDHKIRSLVRT